MDAIIAHRLTADKAAGGAQGNRTAGPVGDRPDPGEVARVLDLATSDPRAALALTRGPTRGATTVPRSVVRQAEGIALRELGRIEEAMLAGRIAVRTARAGADPDRLADAMASLGVTLVLAGRTRTGLATLRRAVAASDGPVAPRVRTRLGSVLELLDRPAEGMQELDVAVTDLRRRRDRVWEARALGNRAMCRLATAAPGAAARADADLSRAVALFRAAGQLLDAAKAGHNRGLAAALAGDLPAALRLLDTAADSYAALDVDVPELAQDRCGVLVSAGLAEEALRLVEEALARQPPPGLRVALLWSGALAALHAGDPGGATERAERTRTQARMLRRPAWEIRAAALVVRARITAGEVSPEVIGDGFRLAARLWRLDPSAASATELAAGRAALVGPAGPRLHSRALLTLARLAEARRSGTALTRTTAWLAEAVLRTENPARGSVDRACTAGLSAVREHLATLGSAELRALGTSHGLELARLAASRAARRGDARALLRTAESWRAVAATPVSVLPPADPGPAAGMTALRDVGRRLVSARETGAPTATLLTDQTRLERLVRARTHSRSGAGGGPGPQAVPGTAPMRVTELLTSLGDHVLLELVDVDGTLVAVLGCDGRVSCTVVGPVATAVAESRFARMALASVAHGRVRDLSGVAARLGAALLGPALPGPALPGPALPGPAPPGPALYRAGGWSTGRPVVLVPPAALLTAPWGLVPGLSGVPLSVCPSAAAWVRSRRPARGGPTVLVAGPGLPGATLEIAALAEVATSAGTRVLSGAGAGVRSVLAACDGAGLAHLAVHGVFRADSPMFSGLTLADGTLLIHDLETLAVAPDRVVLAACESADGAAVGADELLGIVSTLLRLGTRGVLAATGPLRDSAAVPVMTAVHRDLAGGADLPAALASARREAADDGVLAATAASLLAVGT